MMPRGCRPVACDPTWICIGLRRSDPIWDEKTVHHLQVHGSTGIDACLLFWKLMAAAAPRLVSGPARPMGSANKVDPHRAYGIFYSRKLVGALPPYSG